MSITEIDKRRIHYHCRRGMLELDVILLGYFEREGSALVDNQWQDFECLLEADDPDLYTWLMGYGHPENAQQLRAVTHIRASATM